MKFEDLKVGMEVLVMHYGKRSDLANASVQAATVLSTERWWPSLNGFDKKTVVVDPATGRPLTVYGWPHEQGTMVPVLMRPGRFTEGGASLVKLGRILGPVETWQPKIDAARREQDTARSERLTVMEQLADRCVGLEQRVQSVGAVVSVRPLGDRVSIVCDPVTMERLVDLLEAASIPGEALATEMHAALDRYHATGEMGEFLVAQKRYNDEERRLQRALYELTGEHYQPTSGRHC